jgi:CHAT domain
VSVDFRVDIEPDLGNAWRLKVSSPTINQANGANLQRLDQPQFRQGDLEEIRRGLPNGEVLQRVSDSLNSWFLGADLSPLLASVVQSAGDERVRLVLNVDARLQPELADVPFELLRLEGAQSPLVLSHRVESLVHLLPKVGRPLSDTTARNWPLNVLLFRANPHDLGGDVPPVASLAETIREVVSARGLPLGAVEIDVWSREDNFNRPATWEEFRRCLKVKSYDILTFLGHGDVLAVPGEPPSGNLLFEDDSGCNSVTKSAGQLAQALQNNVPVVLLVGCLTAAMDGQVADEGAAVWARGQQGVAQALVNSAESGVRIAVGMRSRLETSDAVAFLQGFFDSLLQDVPGNVEVAVRGGRQEMHARRAHPPGWAAPMLFSALEPEPFFSFLGQRPVQEPSLEEHRQLDAQHNLRREFWSLLSKQPHSQRSAALVRTIQDSLDSFEDRIRQLTTPYGPTLMPSRVDAQPNQQVRVLVTMWGGLQTRGLTGRLRLPTGVKMLTCQAHPQLKASGCHLLIGEDGYFRIEPLPAAPETPMVHLSDGLMLFDIVLQLDAAPRALETLDVEVVATDPPQFTWSGDNALIVAV